MVMEKFNSKSFKIDLIVWKYDSGGSFESATSSLK